MKVVLSVKLMISLQGVEDLVSGGLHCIGWDQRWGRRQAFGGKAKAASKKSSGWPFHVAAVCVQEFEDLSEQYVDIVIAFLRT